MMQLLQTGILNESLIQIEWGEYTESGNSDSSPFRRNE